MLLTYLILSVASAFGLAIALVKKQREWPVRRHVLRLRKLLGCVHRRAPKMLDCVICTSFWATLATDLIICISVFPYIFYFAWPLSGFVTVGLSWIIMDCLDSLNAIGRKHED
jgi:hypothetical protein